MKSHRYNAWRHKQNGRSTRVVESKQQGAGDGEREEPHHRNHDGHPPPGAVAGVVE